MSSSNPGQKIGGEYGEVRANIDVDRLNKYLDDHVKEVVAPVEVKQFKVSDRLMLRVGRGGRNRDRGFSDHDLGLLTFLRLDSLDRYASSSVASELFGNS